MFNTRLKPDLSDLEELSRRFPEASRHAREAAVTEAVALLEREIKQLAPYGAGPIHLRDSIFGKVSTRGETVRGVLGTPLEHGEPVESGTKPHFPPVKPLQHWVEKVLGLHGWEAASAAFAIAVKISKEGTEGRQMFEKAFAQNEDKALRILNGIPADIFRRVG